MLPRALVVATVFLATPALAQDPAGATSTTQDMSPQDTRPVLEGNPGMATSPGQRPESPAEMSPSDMSPAEMNPTDPAPMGMDPSGSAMTPGSDTTASTDPASTDTATTDGAEAIRIPEGQESVVLVQLDEIPNADGRTGPRRNRLALVQTTLLNRFSQLGFTQVSEFRREGETYVADAETPDGQDVTVVMDPQQGTIVARR